MDRKIESGERDTGLERQRKTKKILKKRDIGKYIERERERERYCDAYVDR
jgi:hypothetical protein